MTLSNTIERVDKSVVALTPDPSPDAAGEGSSGFPPPKCMGRVRVGVSCSLRQAPSLA